MAIITRKVEIAVLGDNKNEAWSQFRYWDNTVFRMANDVVNHLWFQIAAPEKAVLSNKVKSKELISIDSSLMSIDSKYASSDKQERETLVKNRKALSKSRNELLMSVSNDLKVFYGEARKKKEPSESDRESKSERGSSYDPTKKYTEIPSYIRVCVASKVYKHFKDHKFEILTGKRSLSTYKKGMNIPISSNTIQNIRNEDNGIRFDFTQKYSCVFVFGRDKSNNKIIVENIMSGMYKLCDSEMLVDGKKLFLFLVVKIPDTPNNELNQNITVGVDLGVTAKAYVATNNGFARRIIGNAKYFNDTRIQIANRRRQLQLALTDSIGGHGRNSKLQALEKIKQQEKNFVKTENHKISKAIINFALREHAAIINIEDLSGIKDKASEFVLRNWSYHELQSMIEQKAKRHGITVRKVNPAYSSQTCSKCGNISAEQRDKSVFQCSREKECGFKGNADYNAAKNISKIFEEVENNLV